ncbi:TPA: YqbF domain-containing protein [Listeria monocytogenes]
MSEFSAILKKGENFVLLPQNIFFKKDVPVEISKEVADILQNADEFEITKATSEKAEDSAEAKKAKKSNKD